MSYAIEKVIGRATAYADKTIEALEGQVRDKEEIIALLRHRVKELEAKLAATARPFPSDTPYGVAEQSER
jgi:prefoldin subunit 5